MRDYDAALKLLLRTSAHAVLRRITGLSIQNWLDIELPPSGTRRLDLLGETATGELVHLELQTTNDPKMALRMAEYALDIYRMYERFPIQFCVYVGLGPMNMSSALEFKAFRTQYTLIDLRDVDGEELIESPEIGDNLIAIVTRLHGAAHHRYFRQRGSRTSV